MSTEWENTNITVASASTDPRFQGGTKTVSILLGNINTLAGEVASAASAMHPPNDSLAQMCGAVQTAAANCRAHNLAPPSPPPATWPSCQTAAQHEAYVQNAWQESCGSATAPVDVTWANVKDALDHGGVGGDEPEL